LGVYEFLSPPTLALKDLLLTLIKINIGLTYIGVGRTLGYKVSH